MCCLLEFLGTLLRQPVKTPPADLLRSKPVVARQAKYGSSDKSLADAELAHYVNQATEPDGTATRRDRVSEDGGDKGPGAQSWPRSKLIDE